ncbi:MAG: hypothetical protein J0L92_26775, partial [Deltaproteobacteria bacterium]|nr:hypothetical protein [Deltaproteobacteria bacterium]
MMRSLAWCSWAMALSCLVATRARADSVLVFSTQTGLHRVDADTGVIEETLSSTPIAVARMRDATHVVYLAVGSNTVFDFDLGTRVASNIGQLPGDVGLGCGGQFGQPDDTTPHAPYLVADFLQFAESMTIAHHHACFEVLDRNLNMASVIALIDFDLRTGGVTSSITAAEHCPSLDDATREALPCMRAMRRHARVRELARTRRRVRTRDRAAARSGGRSAAAYQHARVRPRRRPRGTGRRTPARGGSCRHARRAVVRTRDRARAERGP